MEKKRVHHNFTKLLLCFCVCLFLCPAVLKASIVYDFQAFTSNGIYADNPALDLSVNVFDSGGLVAFEFHNNSSIASSVKNIYFDCGTLLSFDHIINFIISLPDRLGTKFSPGGSPADLPAGNSLPQTFDADYSFAADAPGPKWGINPGEKLQIFFASERTFTDIIDSLDAGLISIGMHIIALPDGSSEAATNIPEPATMTLLGLSGLWFAARKKAA